MECKEIRELFFEYREGELSALKKERIVKHLLLCGECAREFRDLLSSFRYLKSVPEEKLPESFYPGLEKKLGGLRKPFFGRFKVYLNFQNTSVTAVGVIVGLLTGIFISNYLPGVSLVPLAQVNKPIVQNKIETKTAEKEKTPGGLLLRAGNISRAGFDPGNSVSSFEGSSGGLIDPGLSLGGQSALKLSKKYTVTVAAGKYEEAVKELNRLGYIMKLPGKKELAAIKNLKASDIVTLELEIAE